MLHKLRDLTCTWLTTLRQPNCTTRPNYTRTGLNSNPVYYYSNIFCPFGLIIQKYGGSVVFFQRYKVIRQRQQSSFNIPEQ